MFKLEKVLIRLISLLLLVILLFVLFFCFLIQSEKGRLEILLSESAKEKDTFFERLLELKSSSLKTFVDDYTVYDGTVNFVRTLDKKWAKENLDIGLETFRANAIWIFKPNLSLIYSATNIDSDSLKAFPIPTTSFIEIFERDRLSHFFHRTDYGLLEMVGATIHPTVDSERKTKPEGYFFVGRLWDNEFLNEISKLTGSKVEILPYIDKKYLSGYERESKNIVVSKILHKFDGTPAAVLLSQSDVPMLKDLSRLFNINLLSLGIFSVSILVVTVFF